ncbi:TIGR03084 family metal-binding protein [Actinomadura scrupuli]|uniref:TIGR03084 family metal-binding protein n=1 Tax=Actinomadura scrupuli TaxID=559629 RepID=UPI003D97ED5A
MTGMLADLRAEGDDLDMLVAGLPAAGWATETPAEGWTIAHQIAHLAWTDDQAILAATDPGAFQAMLAEALAGPADFVEEGAAEGAAVDPATLLTGWRAGRGRMTEALAGLPAGTRLPWFGPPMSAASMATARLMETWAHGQDVADALGVVRTPTSRLRHVAHIGARTRDFAFHGRGLTPPGEEFRVVLTAPDGQEWAWGPDGARQSVTGPVLDFCLLVTQRRNRADLELTAAGADADRWLDIAQAFAGPPGPGRPPSVRA